MGAHTPSFFEHIHRAVAADKRACVVQEALSWIPTPYVLKGRVKHAGADCFTFPAEVMIACGLFTRENLPPYHHDWFLHKREEHYLMLLRKHAAEIITAVCWPTLKIEPGNIVAERAAGSKVFNHSAIVIEWPRCIHCVKAGGVCEFVINRDPMWAYHEVKVFDPFKGPQ
jgi:hypothetical protein